MDEFLKYQDKLVAGEDVSGYKFSGEVTQMPKQFNEWVKNNEERIKSAKSMPYFIRDNYVGGDISKGLKFQSVAQLTKTNVFTEATSMTEVVERLKMCGIKDIEIGANLTLTEANIALEAIEEEAKYRRIELNRFGVASNLHKRADLRAVTPKQEIGGFYNSEKKILYIDASIFRQSIYRNPGTWEQRIKALEEKIVKSKEDITKYEGYLGKNKKFDKEIKGYISNAKQQILGFEKQIYQFNQFKKQGVAPFTTTFAEQFEDIRLQAKAQIHHELGHYVDDVLGRPSATLKGVHQSISEYGNKFANEGFAEWYAHYRMKGGKGVPEDLRILFENYDKPLNSEIYTLSEKASIEKALKNERKRLLRQRSEVMTIIGKNGQILDSVIGTFGNVHFDDEIAKKIKDNIITHNHPRSIGEKGLLGIGRSLSDDDMFTAIKCDARSIVAETQLYRYSATRNGNAWNVTAQELKKRYTEIYNKLRLDYKKQLNVGDRSILLQHLTMKKLSKEFGFIYSYKRI
ncbi:MAG: hypothetical protein IJ341_07375 [Bacteroidales bacterium]|nr:hypothetical protein [Bacteroidales bacterium]MBQ7819501.1 hypothetical protein [Bacteroidales bacterium]